MKRLIFKHYLYRSLKGPVGIGIVTGLPTVMLVIMTMALTNTLEAGTVYMHDGFNMISTSLAPVFLLMFQLFGGNILLDHIYPDLRGERRWRMFAMPVRPNDYVFGAVFAGFLFCVIQGGIVIGISAVFLDAYWGNPWVLILTLLAFSAISQLIWMLLFLLFPKKGTVEVVGQCVIWVMMLASGFLSTVSGGNVLEVSGPVQEFLYSYGTPVSLASRALRNSGFIGSDMSDALLCLGILYALLVVLAAAVILVGKKRGFASETSAVNAAAPRKKGIWERFEDFFARVEKPGRTEAAEKPQEISTSNAKDEFALTAPAHRGGGLTIYKFALLRAWRNPLSLLFNAVLPLVLVLIPALWRGESAFGFSFVGVAIMYGAFIAARGILIDKLDGTLVRIFTTPTTNLQYLTQNLMAALTPLAVQILAVGLLGSALYGWQAEFVLRLMLLYFIFAAASVAFSFAWSCFFKERETSYAVFSVAANLVAMLGGFYVPLHIMPNVLRYIGALFPAYWMSNGVAALQGGSAMGGYLLSAAVIALFAVLYLVYGSKRRIV